MACAASRGAAAPPDAAPAVAAPLPAFELKSGDRVVFIGSTLLEREGRYGFFETALTSRFADRHVTFRNLAWSGDTVYGHARSYFDGPEAGFIRLKKHLDTIDPTVAMIGYGWSESWEGEKGIEPFVQGMDRLLDLLAARHARVVLITPPPHEAAANGANLAERNLQLRRYRDVMTEIAARRGCYLLDLFAALDGNQAVQDCPLTDNGVHFTAFGYWFAAPLAVAALGIKPEGWMIDIDASQQNAAAGDVDIKELTAGREQVSFTAAAPRLMRPSEPAGARHRFARLRPRW